MPRSGYQKRSLKTSTFLIQAESYKSREEALEAAIKHLLKLLQE